MSGCVFFSWAGPNERHNCFISPGSLSANSELRASHGRGDVNKPVGSKGLACPHAGATLDEVKLDHQRSPSFNIKFRPSFIAANGVLAPSARLGQDSRGPVNQW